MTDTPLARGTLRHRFHTAHEFVEHAQQILRRTPSEKWPARINGDIPKASEWCGKRDLRTGSRMREA
jgi:hypothetical protein